VHYSQLRNKKIYKIALWGLLIVSVFVLARLSPILSTPANLRSDDYVRFWAGGRLNSQGENPYDPLLIEQLQIEAGGQPTERYSISVILNPPWSIALVMPFGLFGYPISRLAWLVFSSLALLISSQILWRIYSGNLKQRWLVILVVFIFAPVISVLEKGQITPLVVLGICGFLYYSVSQRNDWLAGIFLALASIKPQLALIFWIALLFWVIKQHRWLILISTAITILSLTLIAMVFNPHIIQQYFSMLQTYQISDWANPTIGSYLRFFWLGTDKYWPQYLPSLLGFIWFLYYWNRHQESWNWMDELPILLLVSQITSPFTWTYDLVILIPAIVLSFIRLAADWKNWSALILLVIFFGVNILDLLLHMKLDEFWFIWMAPALLLWFLLVQGRYMKLLNSQPLSVSNIT
jgi:hypothetical protein